MQDRTYTRQNIGEQVFIPAVVILQMRTASALSSVFISIIMVLLVDLSLVEYGQLSVVQ